jgi:hypothetical protein
MLIATQAGWTLGHEPDKACEIQSADATIDRPNSIDEGCPRVNMGGDQGLVARAELP